MDLFIFKTNLNSDYKIFRLRKALSDRTLIKKWSVDLEDVDKVLKVIVNKGIEQLEVIAMLENQGIHCEELE